jgi:hypothetical protein
MEGIIPGPVPKERHAISQGVSRGSGRPKITPRRALWLGSWLALFLVIFSARSIATANATILTGRIEDACGIDSKLSHVASACHGVSGATVSNGSAIAVSDKNGNFSLQLPAGDYKLLVSANGYAPITLPVTVSAGTELTIQLAPMAPTTVVASIDEAVSSHFYSADELPPPNSGRPGTPLSLPGLPSETASGGIKAPQYFAPGVAGDHGEPIAQYIRIGDSLVPNNLPANAHGNGYADPNLLIAASVAGADIDGGAFDARHGNNAEDLAVTYELEPRLEPFLQVGGDSRNFDVVSGWSPVDRQRGGWLGFEAAGGDGYLDLPEHRRQYKVNGERSFALGRHQLTLFGAGYYGTSRIPGLVPIDMRLLQDTIDPRQSDRAHTELFVGSDTWQLAEDHRLQFSGYFRTYGLSLFSNFGDGLIRQSEFRTVQGGNTTYQQRLTHGVSLETGFDLRRDAPRDSELSHLSSAGIFQPVTRSDFTIVDTAAYVSLNGSLSRYFSYTIGLRHDNISFDNLDRLVPSNSYHAHSGVTSPRGTISFRTSSMHLPTLAFSLGEGFHTNDPRIRQDSGRSTPIATARAYQLVATENFKATDFRLTLARVSSSSQLAKLDADTGLQEDVGPSLVRSLTASVRHRFAFGTLQASFARATATKLLSRQDVPEAPRLIWDVSGNVARLPWHMRAAGELEYIGRKPLGDGFTAVPVRELHGSITRPFIGGRFAAGVYFQLASGYTGQTIESVRLGDELAGMERIVGVRNPSYAGVSLNWHFRREE